MAPNSLIENKMEYAMLIYYEPDGVEDLVVFAATQNLHVLYEVRPINHDKYNVIFSNSISIKSTSMPHAMKSFYSNSKLHMLN